MSVDVKIRLFQITEYFDNTIYTLINIPWNKTRIETLVMLPVVIQMHILEVNLESRYSTREPLVKFQLNLSNFFACSIYGNVRKH